MVLADIDAAALAQRRVQLWLELGDLRAFKIKLGSPAGIAADREMFSAVAETMGLSRPRTSTPKRCANIST